jgi:transcription initiation factor IIE alpha subunit
MSTPKTYTERFLEIERASEHDRTVVEQLVVERVESVVADWRMCLEQALYGLYDEQERLGRVCVRCNAHLDQMETHSETCPYPSLAFLLGDK